jgi:hypothetical protein
MPSPAYESSELSSLPLDDPIEALDRARDANCNGLLPLRSIEREGARWVIYTNLSHDLAEQYVYPHNVHLPRIAQISSHFLCRYAAYNEIDARDIPRNFVYAFGALLANDAQGFKDKGIAIEAALYYSPYVLPYIAGLYSSYEDVTQTAISASIYRRRANPFARIDEYVADVSFAANTLVPQLSEKFQFEPLSRSVIRTICYQRNSRQAIENVYQFSGEIRNETGINSAKIVHWIAATARVTKQCNEFRELDPATVEVNEQTAALLARLREAAHQSKVGGKAGESIILAAAIKKVITKNPEYNVYADMDVLKAAKFVAATIRLKSKDSTQYKSPVSLATKVSVGVAYLRDVLRLQGSGVLKPYACARFWPPSKLSELRTGNPDIPLYTIKKTLEKYLRAPQKRIDLLRTRGKEYQAYLQQYDDIEINLQTIIIRFAPYLRDKAIKHMETFVADYRHLAQKCPEATPKTLCSVAAWWSCDLEKGIRKLLRYKNVSINTLKHGSKSEQQLGLADTSTDPAEILFGSPEITKPSLALMSVLTPYERAALAHLFGLPLGEAEEYDERSLEQQFTTNDLETYAMEVILPKLRGAIES